MDGKSNGFVPHVLLTMFPAVQFREPLVSGPENSRVAVHPGMFAVRLPVNVPLGAGVNVPTITPSMVPVLPLSVV